MIGWFRVLDYILLLMSESNTKTPTRTRFAPSPTGYMHVGGIRTALFAWLVARQAGGQFVLRIEDTDQQRQVEGAEQHIIRCLEELGLYYDEGPNKQGSFGPYRQSERLEIYHQWAQKLIESNRAYWDINLPEDLDKLRKGAKQAGRPFRFINHRPSETPKGNFFGKLPLRFRSEPKEYKWHDEVMGDLGTRAEVVDDFVLIKSDGFPTYNFAHIVDDEQMQISHVIRGQEFLASVPNYLNLYEALGLVRPKLATVPHILAPVGGKKLSKRDGAKDVLEYIDEGFLPDALVSFIATLGWNDGTEQEVFSRQELVDKFSLDRVGRSGAHFDEQRLSWTNGHFIRQMPLDELMLVAKKFWPECASNSDTAYLKQVLGLVQERLKYLAELPELCSFFFIEPKPDLKLIESNKQLTKFANHQLAGWLRQSQHALEQTNFSVSALTQCLNSLLIQTQQKPRVLFSLIRVATTWAPASPSLAETIAVLGREKTLPRLSKAASLLEN